MAVLRRSRTDSGILNPLWELKASRQLAAYPTFVHSIADSRALDSGLSIALALRVAAW